MKEPWQLSVRREGPERSC